MSYMKYVRSKHGEIIIFSPSMKHSDIAECVGGKKEIESAGQIGMAIDENEISCYGESLTLGVRSDKEDRGRVYRNISMYS